jgi:catecholate siderophore receptor
MELFDNHLLLTASMFQTTKDNARETVGTGAAAIVVGSGEYVIRGIDVGVTGKINERWSIFGGAVWMDSEVTESSNPANIGKKLANIAHGSFNLLAKYDVTAKVTVGGQATYKSKIYGGSLAANQNELPAGWRFDAFAEYKFTPKIVGKVMVHEHLQRSFVRRVLSIYSALRLSRARACSIRFSQLQMVMWGGGADPGACIYVALYP